MKSYRKELWFNVPARRGFVNITSEVETCLCESGVREGLVLCNAMHITRGVIFHRVKQFTTVAVALAESGTLQPEFIRVSSSPSWALVVVCMFL